MSIVGTIVDRLNMGHLSHNGTQNEIGLTVSGEKGTVPRENMALPGEMGTDTGVWRYTIIKHLYLPRQNIVGREIMTRADKLTYINNDVTDAARDFYATNDACQVGTAEWNRLKRLRQLRDDFITETTELGNLLPYPSPEKRDTLISDAGFPPFKLTT